MFAWYPYGTPARQEAGAAPQKCAIYLAPRAGFEPATNRLTAGVFVGLFNQASTPIVQARPSGLPAIARALTW